MLNQPSPSASGRQLRALSVERQRKLVTRGRRWREARRVRWWLGHNFSAQA
jgi:hypothetical protein